MKSFGTASTASEDALLLRSALYTPGSRRRAVAKGREVDADCLILDLEDAVAPSAKEEARTVVLEEMSKGGYGDRAVTVRVNGLDTPWGSADLQAVRNYIETTRGGTKVAAVVLPKVESAEHVVKCISMLGERAPVWSMIETPLGVLNANNIASAHPQMRCLVAGSSDLTKDLHALHTSDRLPLLFSLSQIVLAARANHIFALDGVHLDLEDDAGFAASVTQGRQMGFDGKTLIHPKTVRATNRAFAPKSSELEQAARIIEAHAEASARGQGVVVVDGQLIENLHVENAHRLRAIGEAIKRKEGPPKERWRDTPSSLSEPDIS